MLCKTDKGKYWKIMEYWRIMERQRKDFMHQTTENEGNKPERVEHEEHKGIKTQNK